MKKYLIVMAIAAIAASCTYDSGIPSRRTPDNLAFIHSQLLSSSVTAAVLVLSDTDGSKTDYILKPAFDTLVTKDAFKEVFGLQVNDMSITLTADSTWTFTSADASSISFTGTLKLAGRDKNKALILNATYAGVYDEGNGFSADFGSDNLKHYWENMPVYYQGYGYFNQLTLMREGEAYLTTWKGTSKLDELKLTYKGSEVSY